MENRLKVDKQGRLILPSTLRERLGLRAGGGTLAVRLDGYRMIIEPISEDLENAVREWKKIVTGLHSEAFTESAESSWKWMSVEYAKRKLGLR